MKRMLAPAIGAQGPCGRSTAAPQDMQDGGVDQGHARSPERGEPGSTPAQQMPRTRPYPAVFARQLHDQLISQSPRNPVDHFRFASACKQKMR